MMFQLLMVLILVYSWTNQAVEIQRLRQMLAMWCCWSSSVQGTWPSSTGVAKLLG